MKKLALILVTCIFALSLCACNNPFAPEDKPQSDQLEVEDVAADAEDFIKDLNKQAITGKLAKEAKQNQKSEGESGNGSAETTNTDQSSNEQTLRLYAKKLKNYFESGGYSYSSYSVNGNTVRFTFENDEEYLHLDVEIGDMLEEVNMTLDEALSIILSVL